MPCGRTFGEAAGMDTSCTAIEVEHLRKLYGQQIAVDDVSFTVAEGEIFGLLGRNGAGKSTTVDCRDGTGASCGSCSASSCRRASCRTS